MAEEIDLTPDIQARGVDSDSFVVQTRYGKRIKIDLSIAGVQRFMAAFGDKLAAKVAENLRAGLGPDGVSPMPKNNDGSPSGVNSGRLAAGIRFKVTARGGAVYASDHGEAVPWVVKYRSTSGRHTGLNAIPGPRPFSVVGERGVKNGDVLGQPGIREEVQAALSEIVKVRNG